MRGEESMYHTHPTHTPPPWKNGGIGGVKHERNVVGSVSYAPTKPKKVFDSMLSMKCGLSIPKKKPGRPRLPASQTKTDTVVVRFTRRQFKRLEESFSRSVARP